jgi:hypothetical protein
MFRAHFTLNLTQDKIVDRLNIPSLEIIPFFLSRRSDCCRAVSRRCAIHTAAWIKWLLFFRPRCDSRRRLLHRRQHNKSKKQVCLAGKCVLCRRVLNSLLIAPRECSRRCIIITESSCRSRGKLDKQGANHVCRRARRRNSYSLCSRCWFLHCYFIKGLKFCK